MVLGPTAAMFSILLVVTGVAKLVSPTATARAIRATGLPVHDQVGRLLGALEMTIGLGAVLTGLAELFLGQGLIYALFLAWVLVAKAKSVPLESCGCLGTPDTPPYWGHLAVDALAVASSLGVAASGPVRLIEGPPSEVVAGMALAVLGAALSWVIIGDGARMYGVLRP